MIRRFGITGSMCCGKSTVTNLFRKENIPVIDGDIIARKVVEPGKPALRDLVNHFGNDILLSDGNLDRKKMGQLIWHNPSARYSLDRITHPYISREVKLEIDRHDREGYDIVGYDSALIIESGDAVNFRPLIVVYCEPETQVVRLMKRNSLTRDEAVARINCQLSSEEKLKFANYMINTSGSIEETMDQVYDIIWFLK